MSTELTWQTISTGSADTMRLGELLASSLTGGEVIELRSDLGGGKTTFTQGLARGAGSKDIVASPTFTLKKIYHGKSFDIYHYDFYRLNDPGILRDELAESLDNPQAIIVIEWSDIVGDVLPKDRLQITLKPAASDPDERQINIAYPEKMAEKMRKLETAWVSRP